ncbi:MAG: efflux RND transporter permease subunit, partial [Thermoplasmata archaeon]
MDVKSWFQKKIFDSFPLLVSGSPSKIIAVIIVLTLILGYFASFAEMDTDEETFEPDTQTADRMDEIEEEFGTAGDYSQVVFIGDIGDTLTQEVLLDMLHTKEAILEHEEINQTLMKDGGVPDGVMTLADIVIQANRTQQLSRSLENIYDDLEELHVSMKNQTEMYERLNISLQNNHILAESSDQDIREESKEIFKSMSYIISNPDSWEILQEYMDMLERILDPDSTEGTAGVNENTSEDDEEIPEEGQYFIEMFEASARILYENDPTPEERRAVGRMLTYFLEISEHIAHVKPDFGFVEDIPSVEPTLDEKKEQVENMTDRDIKRSLKEVHEYEPELLRDSIDRSVDILGEAEKEDERSYDHLEDTNETLENLEEIYEEESWEKEMEPYVENYSSTLDGYFDLLDGTLDVITGMSVTMRSAEFLPDLIHEMARTTVSISSEEFDGEDLVVRRIRARSGMALVLMNDSIDSDTRREAQEELIELTEEIPENSHTKVYASQVMLEEINDSAMRSMSRLLPLAFVFVVFVLILVYKSVTETLLSLISLTIAIIWTFGAGVLLGYKFNPLIVAVPILLTGLIIDYGIHMVMRYREEKAKSKSPSASTKIAIITVGGALLLTTVTTAIGFLSNVFSDLLVIRQFGILAAIGICSSLILMVGFLPAILQIVEEKGLDEKNKKTEKKLDSTDKNDSNKYTKKFLSISSIIANKKPWAIIVATLLITMVAGYGAANVDTTLNIE